MMREATKAISKVRGDAFAAILLLSYLDVAGLAGFIVESHMEDGLTCWPYVSIFGVLEETGCSSAQNWLWFFATDLPRIVIVVPALALALIRASVNNGFDGHYFANAIPWLLYSIPLVVVGWFCARNWRNMQWQLATLLLAAFIAEVIHLAASE